MVCDREGELGDVAHHGYARLVCPEDQSPLQEVVGKSAALIGPRQFGILRERQQ